MRAREQTAAAGGSNHPPPAVGGVVSDAEDLVGIAGKMAGLGGWQLDLASDLVTWSRQVAATHGMPATRTLTRAQALSLYLPTSRDRFSGLIEACATRGDGFDGEFELLTPAGAGVWTRAMGQALHGPQGGVIAVQGACQDITEHKRAQGEAQRLATQLCATLESMTDAFMMLDPDARICYVNQPFERTIGRPRASLVGRLVWEALSDARGTLLESELRRTLQGGEAREFEAFFPLPVQKWLAVRQFPSPDGCAVYFRDVTQARLELAERAQREQQSRQAQKLESLGALAGGVAHEFNNMLGAILGNVGLALEVVPAQHPARDNLAQVQVASLRARELVQRILTFSRPLAEVAVRRATPLLPIVEESLKLLRAMLPSTVELATRMARQCCFTLVDPASVQQVLVNLCTNAWQALPDGRGTIEVGMERVGEASDGPIAEPGGDAVVPAGLAGCPCVRLWVRDEGCGMDEATRARIFDPFFTTKPRGTGTGLGLSIVHGIVKASQGEIVVQSTPGRGTCFSVYWPLSGEAAEPSARPVPVPVAGTPANGQGRLVFIVDDDPIVLMTSEQILLRRGFQVRAFEHAADALQALAQDPQGVHALVTDFSMPGLTGLDLAREVHRLQPGLPVVLSSGYLSDEVRAAAQRAGIAALIFKENLFDDLANVVGDVLEHGRAAP